MPSNTLIVPVLVLVLLAGGTSAPSLAETPETQATPTVHKIPHKPGAPVTVTIYQFRSSVAEIPERASTDMFITALVQNGTFHVVERSQLNQGLIPEKQLNGQNLSTGKTATQKLRGVDYIFEGTISEANAAETQNGGSFGVAGMAVTRGSAYDVIAVDVRIVDAATGDVLDAITVRKKIQSKTSGVSGIGNLIGTIFSRKGKDTTYVPDASVQHDHHDGVDAALRAAITDSVALLAARY